jgi:mono/diheme cytochrome c family protein
MLNGDIVDAGIPLDLYNATLGILDTKSNELNRTGINASINFQYNAFISKNGAAIVAPNCFQCHGGYVDNKFIIGLGNTQADFTTDQSAVAGLLDGLVVNRYGINSKEYESYQPFSRSIKKVGPNLKTNTVGSNAADKLALVLAAHRDIENLTWKDNPNYPIPSATHPIDVPPLWNVKYKNQLYYSGLGVGDFARLIMASSILTMKDSARAREVDLNYVNVVAYINSLTPPKYPKTIDKDLALKGEEVFNKNCSKCHGSYTNGQVNYPNLIVSQSHVKTDESVIQFYTQNKNFIDWYNASWFAKGADGAKLIPTDGYVAPPLTGIWASAPYLHNGSVPTLDAVIDSKLRPTIWEKSVGNDNYDHSKLGLKHTAKSSKGNNFTYDTNLKGHSNKGHYFGDKLSKNEKKSLLEYLKSL